MFFPLLSDSGFGFYFAVYSYYGRCRMVGDYDPPPWTPVVLGIYVKQNQTLLGVRDDLEQVACYLAIGTTPFFP